MIERIIPIAVVDNNSLGKLFRLSVNDFSGVPSDLIFFPVNVRTNVSFFRKGDLLPFGQQFRQSARSIVSMKLELGKNKRDKIGVRRKRGRKIEIYRNFNKRICKLGARIDFVLSR